MKRFRSSKNGLTCLGILGLVLASGTLPVSVVGDGDMERLMSDLQVLVASTKAVRPVRNFSEALTIGVNLRLHQLIKLDFKNQVMVVKVTLEQRWKHYLLRWDEAAYGGIKKVHFPASQFWAPDLALYNVGIGGSIFFESPEKVIVSSTGTVDWKSTGVIRAACELQGQGFRTQKYEYICVLKLGSWVYDGFQLDFQPRTNWSNSASAYQDREGIIERSNRSQLFEWEGSGWDLSGYRQSSTSRRSSGDRPSTGYRRNSGWDLAWSRAVTNIKFYTCCDEPYVDMMFRVAFRRRGGETDVLWPYLVTFLPLLAFFVPTDSEQRMTFLVLNFLFVLYQTVPASTAVGAEEKSHVRKFFCVLLALDTLIMAATVLITLVHNRTSQMADSLKKIVVTFAKVTCVEDQAESNSGKGRQADWIRLSKILDRALLLIFLLLSVLGILYLEDLVRF